MKQLKNNKLYFVLITLCPVILLVFSISLKTSPTAAGREVEPDLAAIFDNQLVVDSNGDALPDDIAARFLVNEQTAPQDIEAAAAIAARLGFETSAMNPDLCVPDRETAKKNKISRLITFVGANSATNALDRQTPVEPKEKETCGVRIFRENEMDIIEIFGASPDSRKYAAVNFFSRFPYIWDITGRETGETWESVKQHIVSLLPQQDGKKAAARLAAITYIYQAPLREDAKRRRLERLGLQGSIQQKGEAADAAIEVLVPGEVKTAKTILENLAADHKSGDRTNILNYAGLKNTIIHIISSADRNGGEIIEIPRIAASQRFLNPAADTFFFKKKVTINDVQSDIAGFYTVKGIYQDNDADGFADRLVTRLIYDGPLPYSTVELAARIGLEECAVSLPFIINAADLDMKSIQNLERPILLGQSNRFSDYLIKIGKAYTPALNADEGFIQFSAGFNPGGIYIIGGSSPAGENAALQYAARTLPYICPGLTKPGVAIWQDLSREVELFFSRKSDAGIAAHGIMLIDRQEKAFTAPDLESSETQLYTLRRVKDLDLFISRRIQEYKQKLLPERAANTVDLSMKNLIIKSFTGSRARGACTRLNHVSSSSDNSKYINKIGYSTLPHAVGLEKSPPLIKTGGRLEAAQGFTDRYSPPWEVDEAREIFTLKVLPRLQDLAKEQAILFIDLRLSEPREVLEQQVAWLEDLIVKAGFKKEQVQIRAICAYKQGFHWLKDWVIPLIKAQSAVRETKCEAAKIQVRFAPYPQNFDETRKYWPEQVRWLQELYPIDEILAKELGTPLEKISFIKDEKLTGAVYEVAVSNPAGEIFFKEAFTPFTTEMPFQERFREWGKVTVSTGGMRVEYNHREIFSCTIDTDPLRLWKHYQGKILPDLTTMLEKQAGGALKMEDQPFFSKLQAKVWMSEPDYRLGLDEEMVSSLESFHEDIYFDTLDYFQGLVKKDPEMDVEDPMMAQRWTAPGNIVPIIYPSRTGQGPLLETEATGLESLSPKVEMKFQYRDIKEPVKITEKITPLKKMKSPRLTCIVVDKNGGVKEAVYTQDFSSEEEMSDAMDMLRVLAELRKEKLFNDTFTNAGLAAVRFILTGPAGLKSEYVLTSLTSPIVEKDKSFRGGIRGAAFSKGGRRPQPKMNGHESLKNFDPLKAELDKALGKVMSPEDTIEMSQRLSSLPGIDYYIGGCSYQGRAVPVLEISLPPQGTLTSLRKITTYKPTVFILGRQHANEVSSTNYGFNIAWLLARDPAYRKYLEKLNVVIEPMENPDGSALAVELQKLTPFHILHAGRYSALGTDIGYHVNKPDTLITEARVRQKLIDRWQPDLFLNNHGYPSHEWVQQFSDYTPYLFRAYWAPRGWYYFHTGLDSIGTPLHKEAGERLVEIISGKMKSDAEIFETNRRIYDRYRRWAERWQPHIHYLELYDGTNIYKKRRGGTAVRPTRNRNMTVVEAVPEVMDETARDEWLRLSIRQGTLFITAFLDLAVEAEKPIERIEEESGEVVHLQIIRHRPFRVKK